MPPNSFVTSPVFLFPCILRAVDFVVKHIEDHGMTQAQAAAVVGWSRQNLWDKLNNRNPRFNTMLHILISFGYELHVVRDDGLSPDCFDERDYTLAHYGALRQAYFCIFLIFFIKKDAPSQDVLKN